VWLPSVIETVTGLFRGGKKSIDLGAVEKEVLRIHGQGGIRELRFDPYQLHSVSLSLSRAGVPLVEVPQGNQRVECDEHLRDLAASGGLAHPGDADLTAHVLSAVLRESVRGFRLDKQRASRRIDLAVCLSMSAFGAAKWAQPIAPAGGPGTGDHILMEWASASGAFGDDVQDGPKKIWISDGTGGEVEVLESTVGKSHKPGVTPATCALRSKGCWACVVELGAAGYYERERDFAERKRAELGGEQTSEEVADMDFLNRLGIPDRMRQQAMEEQNEHKLLHAFKDNARHDAQKLER
jgi:hypothetical protein